MKRTIKTILLLVFLAWIVVFLVGQIKWPIQLDQGWSQQVQAAETQNGDRGSVNLYKWRDTIILLQHRYDWSSKSSLCSIMTRNNASGSSWTQLPLSDVPSGYHFYAPVIDSTNNRILFEQGYTENDQLVMSIIFVRVTNGRVQVGPEQKWKTDQRTLLGETPPNVHINDPGRRGGPILGFGVVDGPDLYVPFCIAAERYEGRGTIFGDGPFNNGVFHSPDAGATWQMERISDFYGSHPTMCRSGNYYYYLLPSGYGKELRCFRKPIAGGSWEASEVVTKNYASVDGGYIVTAEGDTTHICWLDRRHSRWRFNPEGPILEDHEIVYCHRKDSDTHWSPDIIVSKGVRQAYEPAMSIDGNKIVIVWSGHENAGRGFANGPTEIFYATSKDSGKTWAKPLKVTNGTKDGITASAPQVAVQNGVIHLFYVQGKEDRHLSRQAPWPIYYQQRPFPN